MSPLRSYCTESVYDACDLVPLAQHLRLDGALTRTEAVKRWQSSPEVKAAQSNGGGWTAAFKGLLSGGE